MMFFRWVILSILGVLCLISNGFSQVVTTKPEFPTANDAVTVYFDATQGNQELKDFTGDIYAHTGLITSQSSDSHNWKYIIADWTENTTKAKLTRISSNYYSLEIQPSILDFYGVAESEEVFKLAFVFRNSDGSKVAREADDSDIFANVYEPGLNVNITSPTDDFIMLPGETVEINASSNDADSLFLYIDDILITKIQSTTLTYNHTENTAGSHKIKVMAKNTEETAIDSVYYFVRGNAVVESLPVGWKKGINYLADDSVGLVLFAPYKDFVFAIGDFSEWRLDEKYLMKRTPDTQYYWVGIGGLTPGKEYIFQYYIDGDLRIADPYTEKTSDPIDKFIDNVTYPALIDYPSDYTYNIASVFQTNQAIYTWKNENFEKPEKSKLIIYELLIRDFVAKHNYQTLIDTLDYLDSLGVNAIELMPFNEFEGNESWGYNPSFYFAPDKYYGPKNKLKEFIDSCHSRGIAVIMDMVLNHSYGQSPMVQMYFNKTLGRPSADNPWYNEVSPNSTYSWGYDFNHESIYTEEFVDSVNSFWLEHYKVDGFRFDFTKGFTNTPGDGWNYDIARINILKRMAIQIWEVDPDAYVILEHLAENSEEKNLADFGMMLWGNMNYQYNEASMGYSSDINGISYKSRSWAAPNLVGYMESHDEERLMYKNLQYGNSAEGYDIKYLYTALNRIELAANFFIPIPGPKMIWQFGELGYDYSIDYDCRVCNKPIRWDYFTSNRKRLYYVFKSLNELKKKYDVFSTTNYTITQTSKLKSLHLFDDEMNVVILGNFDVTSQDINPQFPSTGDWYEYYTSDTLTVNNTDDLINLKPGEYRLYTSVKLEQPNIPLDANHNIINDSENLTVYPNPSQGIFNIDVPFNNQHTATIKIYNIQGQIIKEQELNNSINTFDISSEKNGIYFYILRSGNRSYTGKLIKQ